MAVKDLMPVKRDNPVHPPNTLAGLFERVDELIVESKKLLSENIQLRKDNEALRSRLALMEKDQKCHSR